MARTRLELHEELCSVLGTRNCYFSAPSQLAYPCIVYSRENPSIRNADNIKYINMSAWTIQVIDYNPDSELPDQLSERFGSYFSKEREYARDGLYHFIYRLYW